MMEGLSNYLERIQSSFQVTLQKMQPKIVESMNEHGVTPTQFYVLIYLCKQRSCKISELAEYMGVKPSAVTFMIDRLEQNNFVVREHDKKDRRVVNISLSNEGEEKLKTVINARKAIAEQFLSYLSEEELAQFASIAEKLAEATTKEK
jgi:DNA-binding MarR family transcriptional regulator